MIYKNISLEADFLIKQFETQVAKKEILDCRSKEYLTAYFNKNYFGDNSKISQSIKNIVLNEFLEYLID